MCTCVCVFDPDVSGPARTSEYPVGRGWRFVRRMFEAHARSGAGVWASTTPRSTGIPRHSGGGAAAAAGVVGAVKHQNVNGGYGYVFFCVYYTTHIFSKRYTSLGVMRVYALVCVIGMAGTCVG